MVVRIVWTLAGSSVRADGGPQSSCEQDETFAWVCCFESLDEARDSFLDLAPIEESHPDVVMTERRSDRGPLIPLADIQLRQFLSELERSLGFPGSGELNRQVDEAFREKESYRAIQGFEELRHELRAQLWGELQGGLRSVIPDHRVS